MNNRQRFKAIMNYENYDRIPVINFGYWIETLEKWSAEGHIKPEELEKVWDNSPNENVINKRLGFDYNYSNCCGANTSLSPGFGETVEKVLPDGSEYVRNGHGVLVHVKKGQISIPAEIDHLLKDRESWEKEYLPRLAFAKDRLNMQYLNIHASETETRDLPLGIWCGSFYGQIRDWMGVVGLSYLQCDDEELFGEIIDTVGNLMYDCVKSTLEVYSDFDFAHIWEDICYNHGPLVNPVVFKEKVGRHYKRVTDLLHAYGIHTVSLDCDGKIDELIPTWFENGVNTMFPIEVGTWDASIAPWREKYGKGLKGVGGMDKKVFARDYAAVDAEIERLKRLVELGAFIPCPDHRIPPDAVWENVQYYCERMRKAFS